jgi:hypothetical protein
MCAWTSLHADNAFGQAFKRRDKRHALG